MARSSRTEVVQVRVTRADRMAIESAAKRAGMTVSEYLRACTLTIMLADLDKHALRTVVNGVSDAIVEGVNGLRGRSLIKA